MGYQRPFSSILYNPRASVYTNGKIIDAKNFSLGLLKTLELLKKERKVTISSLLLAYIYNRFVLEDVCLYVSKEVIIFPDFQSDDNMLFDN